MPSSVLPQDGAATVGPVDLPTGSRRYTDDDDQLAAWVTVEPMPDAGLAWLALSDAQAETGLVPVLLQADRPEQREPGQHELFGFYHRADPALLDEMSASDVLTAEWEAGLRFADSRSAGDRAPYGDTFPGLAPAERVSLPPDELRRAVAAMPAAHLGLVSAGRSADVPAVVGWSVFGTDFDSPDPLSLDFYLPGARSLKIGAVLRSWEERFGARLLRIGADAILQVLAERPPRTLEAATRLAAECYAFADEVDHHGADTIAAIAMRLVGAPIWTFWWD
jgi:hypothetical protein